MAALKENRGIAIQGSTKVIAIFGDPLTYTLSPKMHNFAISQLGLDFVYVPFVVKPDQLAQATQSLRSLNMVGANITIPHKQKIIPYLDDLTPLARKIGAVNTVIRRGSKLIGENTDIKGFISSLKEDGNFDPKNKKAVLLGSGGVANAISIALLDEGIKKLVILNRTLDHAIKLKTRLKSFYPNAEMIIETLSLATLNGYLKVSDIFLNATPGGAEVDSLKIPSNLFVFDAVYAKVTPLLLAAQKARAASLGGLGMLIRQGALSFSAWTDLEPPIHLMRKALEEKGEA